MNHATQTVNTENGDRGQKSTELAENISEQENKGHRSDETGTAEKREGLGLEGGEIETAVVNNPSNVTTSETKEIAVDNSGNGSSSNTTETQELEDNLGKSNITAEVATEIRAQNVIQNESELKSSQNNATLDVENKHSDSNSTDLETKDSETNFGNLSNSSNSTETLISGESSTEESPVEENDDVDAEKLDTEDVLESELNENPEEIQHDSIDEPDSSDTLEMKDVRTDLETLPEIQTEGTNSEDAASE